MTTEEVTQLLHEHARVSAAAIANFHSTGGHGKQGKLRTDAALKRAAKYSDQLRRLDSAIRALGGAVPGVEPQETPRFECTPVAVLPVSMTLEALHAEDAALEQERRAVGSYSVSPRHRAIKAELGSRNLAIRTAARRSVAGKKAAAPRARRNAAGLPPKQSRFDEMFTPPA